MYVYLDDLVGGKGQRLSSLVTRVELQTIQKGAGKTPKTVCVSGSCDAIIHTFGIHTKEFKRKYQRIAMAQNIIPSVANSTIAAHLCPVDQGSRVMTDTRGVDIGLLVGTFSGNQFCVFPLWTRIQINE